MRKIPTPRIKSRLGIRHAVGVFLTFSFFAAAYFFIPDFLTLSYDVGVFRGEAQGSRKTKEFTVTHLPTPKSVKALYLTSYAAGTEELRSGVVRLLDETEANTIVIDIKDYSGRLAFEPEDEFLKTFRSAERRIPDHKKFVKELHDKGVYVIGRISVFQDPFMVLHKPEWSVKRESDGAIWKDYKDISWIDPGAAPYWDYIVAITREAYLSGFDELNFDYIRFPSDGNMKDISYPWSKDRVKADLLEEFFAYLKHSLWQEKGVVLSADLFGMTTTNTDDLNIGQVLERVLPYFDYVAPMVYPSHYPPGFNGYKNPAAFPYEVVKFSMDRAVERSSTTPGKIRPWLQDFNLGAVYSAEMIRNEKQAVYDAGVGSWMLWNAKSVYTKEALDAATSTGI